MNTVILMLATAIATNPGQEPRGDQFPNERTVYITLREINAGFLKAEPSKDCWGGFIPLLNLVEKYRKTVSAEEVRKVESAIVSRFTLYSFACEYDKDLVKADFDARIECIRNISSFDLVRSDTNTLFQIAKWLSGAVPLDVSEKSFHEAASEAFRRDKMIIYGGRNPPRCPGTVGNTSHWGPSMREIHALFQFRKIYNMRLQKFRKEALEYLHEAITEGYKDFSSVRREEIWSDVQRKAQMIDSEASLPE